MKTTCIIVEDEPLALQRTKSYVLKTPMLELLGAFENALEALAFLNKNTVDLIFLDIQMDELTGIEFLEAIDVKSEIIFTTAYEEYALKGYELNVLDYLLKPFPYSRFLQAINKLPNSTSKKSNYIFVKSGYQLEKILFNNILFIEGMGDYRGFQTENKKTLTLQTFSELLQLLPKKNFIRVHKSYVVSIDKIDCIERNTIMIGEVRIPISATYKEAFFALINIEKRE